jgi:hypothetical protein
MVIRGRCLFAYGACVEARQESSKKQSADAGACRFWCGNRIDSGPAPAPTSLEFCQPGRRR